MRPTAFVRFVAFQVFQIIIVRSDFARVDKKSSKLEYAGLFGTRGYLERGAIWNARLFAHRRLYIFPTFLSFQLIAEKPQPTRSAFGFFQATGSEEVLLDCEFRRDRELLDRPKAFKNAFLHWRISSKFFERFFLACRSKNRRINLE
jgi:hypothetical protein